MFQVEAYNIHTGASETYGPFPGCPKLTYESLMAVGDFDEAPMFLFAWHDPQDIGGADNPHDYDHWTDLGGDTRYDGWRRLLTVRVNPAGEPYPSGGSRTEVEGPFWTDLTIETLTIEEHR